MDKNLYKILGIVTAIILLLFIGFMTGRKYSTGQPTKIEVRYIPGDTIYDTVEVDKPYKVILPIDTLDIVNQAIRDGVYVVTPRIDTLRIPTKIDTLALLKDYATKRIYKEELFDVDTLGTCSIEIVVQYNRVDSLGYSFTPNIREVTITKVVTPTFQPFITGGVSYSWGAYAGGGFIAKSHWGAEATIGIDLNKEVQGRLGILYVF